MNHSKQRHREWNKEMMSGKEKDGLFDSFKNIVLCPKDLCVKVVFLVYQPNQGYLLAYAKILLIDCTLSITCLVK